MQEEVEDWAHSVKDTQGRELSLGKDREVETILPISKRWYADFLKLGKIVRTRTDVRLRTERTSLGKLQIVTTTNSLTQRLNFLCMILL